MRRILFILNPLSGTKKKQSILKHIKDVLITDSFEYKIIETEYPGHATEIVKQNLSGNFDTIVAIGGDGTINEVAELLINKNISLGIIPAGSGNGFARSLDIPMNWKKSLNHIIANKTKLIDTVSINNKYFFNVAGTGFDSHIAGLFALSQKRGFISYIKLTISEFLSFENKKSNLTIDGKKTELDYFMLTFANSPQFGNNAYVSPKSIMDDGFIDIAIFRKFSLASAPFIALRLYLKTLHKSKYVSYIKAKSIKIEGHTDIEFHIDGEPILIKAPINIKVLPLSLNVISA